MSRRYDFVGLGFSGLDYLCLTPRIPADDKVEALATLTQGGGPAATATYTAARLGSRTAFIGVTGDDERGRLIAAGLRDGGVDTATLVIRPNAESPAAFCWTEEPTGHRSIVWTRGGAQALAREEIDIGMIKNARLLHLDGHQTPAAIHAAQGARAGGTTVSIDAGTLVPGIETLLTLSDLVITSEPFAQRFTGEDNPELAVRKLFAGPRRFAAVTLGSKGSIGFDGKAIYRQPSFPVKVVDTTGAGDAFHGAFAYRFLNGGDWAACLRFAAAVAALSCTAFGGRTGIPTLGETERFLSEH
jgi:sugar/nucleoside kinase (ribokinase family)